MRKFIIFIAWSILALWTLFMLFIVFLISIVIIYHEPEVPFKEIELDKSITVVNDTQRPYLDTLVIAGLTELKIKDITVYVEPLTEYSDDENLILKAYILSHPEDNNQYMIRIIDDGRDLDLQYMSHELIHLDQLYSGRLKDEGEYIIWKGDTIYDMGDYHDREWEIEAWACGSELEEKLRSTLY